MKVIGALVALIAIVTKELIFLRRKGSVYAGPLCIMKQGGDIGMKIIDAHVHLGLSDFCTVSETDFQYDLCCTYDEVISLMDEKNIEQAIALPIPHYQFDSKKANNYILEAYSHYPERFIPFCRIDEELEENLNIRGFRGVKLHLVYEEFDIKKNKKYLQIIEDANVPLILHAKFKDKVKQIEEILKYAPNLIIILAHMGRGHIYTGEQVIDNAISLKKYPNVYVDTSTVGDIQAMVNCAEILGVDRVVFGSDYSFGKGYLKEDYDYDIDISLICQAFSPEQAEMILRTNIERILKRSDSNSIQIRRAKKTDTESIMSLLDALCDQDKKFLALKNKRNLIRQTIRSERHCYIAHYNGEIVGYMRESGRPNNYSLLEEIVIHPSFRGMGIAGKMIKYYHNIFSKNMAKTNAGNSTMIHLLTANGYKTENLDAPRIINWVRDGD